MSGKLPSEILAQGNARYSDGLAPRMFRLVAAYIAGADAPHLSDNNHNMPEDVRASVVIILNYMEKDERRDYLESEMPAGHIYIEMQKVRAWLDHN